MTHPSCLSVALAECLGLSGLTGEGDTVKGGEVTMVVVMVVIVVVMMACRLNDVIVMVTMLTKASGGVSDGSVVKNDGEVEVVMVVVVVMVIAIRAEETAEVLPCSALVGQKGSITASPGQGGSLDHQGFMHYRVSNGDLSEPRPLPSSPSDEAVKVDVRRLALLQRESCHVRQQLRLAV
ncbi:hypothetical protein E2C01_018252 [Portunus trituberculatus]|uniref:Uncharacterized protein n=1 Tax=Portunus trituberculatus TaxID=210409 RepID=A0A5B7DUJ0_PORTR|nr:hypothetical protein [Portunus trituberculatus]